MDVVCFRENRSLVTRRNLVGEVPSDRCLGADAVLYRPFCAEAARWGIVRWATVDAQGPRDCDRDLVVGEEVEQWE